MTPSQPTLDKTPKVVEVLVFEEDFEVFNKLQLPKPQIVDFSHLLPVQVSSVQEALSIPDAMVLQRKSKISFLELLESYVGGTVPKVVIQTKPPTPLLAQTSQPDPVDKKRKQDQKGKDVVEEGRGIPTKEPEPHKGDKVARTAQMRSSSEGAIVEWGCDHRTKVQAWNPPLVLNGSFLPIDFSIRDF